MRKTLLPWVDKTKLDMYHLSQMSDAIGFLEQNQECINWNTLSRNKEAIPLLMQNFNKIRWYNLSSNESPDVVKLLEIYGTHRRKYWYYYSVFQSFFAFFFTKNDINIHNLSSLN